jgi:shikimate kinase
MGAGKTTIGRRLARKLGWKFFDLDEEIERRERRKVADIFREDGEPHFRNLEHQALQELAASQKTVIALGGGAFMDPENRELTEKTGLTVWLKAPFSTLSDRVKMDGTRPNFVDREQAENLYRTREASYALAKVHISTDEGTPEAAAEEIMGALRRT